MKKDFSILYQINNVTVARSYFDNIVKHPYGACLLVLNNEVIGSIKNNLLKHNLKLYSKFLGRDSVEICYILKIDCCNFNVLKL